MTEYKSYQHVEHMNNGGFAKAILNGDCWYQTKMDGTNAVVGRGLGGIWVGQRKHVMGEGDDNRGVKVYVLHDHLDQFNKFFDAHPDCVLYGEWLVPHTIRTYAPEAWNKLYIFDVVEMGTDDQGNQIMLRYVPYLEYQPWLDACDLTYIPAVKYIPNGNKSISEQIQDLQDKACKQTYMMTEGQYGEGIVVKNYSFNPRCPVSCIQWAKVVTRAFKIQHRPDAMPEAGSLEDKIVSEFLDTFAVTKEYMKVVEEFPSEEEARKDRGFWPHVLGEVWKAFIDDNLWAILKKYRNPTLSFGALRAQVYDTARDVLGLNGVSPRKEE